MLLSTARTSSAEERPKTPATSATVAAPKKALRRCDLAASSGVSGAGSAPDSTGVSPSGLLRYPPTRDRRRDARDESPTEEEVLEAGQGGI